MRQRVWTRKEIAKLDELLVGGMTHAQAGKVLDRSERSTCRAAQRYGMTSPAYELNPAYVKAYRDIGSIRGVAKYYGVDWETVRKQLKRQGEKLLTRSEHVKLCRERQKELVSQRVQENGWPDVSESMARYLDTLYGREMTVAEVASALGFWPNYTSANLLTLFRQGHVERKVRGYRVLVYSLSPEVEATRRAYLNKEDA